MQSVRVGYDNEGHIVEWRQNDNTKTVLYDAEGNIQRVRFPDASQWSMVHEKKVTSSLTYYLNIKQHFEMVSPCVLVVNRYLDSPTHSNIHTMNSLTLIIFINVSISNSKVPFLGNG